MANDHSENYQKNLSNLFQSFTDDLNLIIDDYSAIVRDKTKNVSSSLQKIKEKDVTLGKRSFKYEDAKDFIEITQKRMHFSYAMFLYLYSTHERHTNFLLKESILNNPKVQSNYAHQFSKLNSEKNIIDATFITQSKEDQIKTQIQYLPDVLKLKNFVAPQSWQIIMGSEKNFLNSTDSLAIKGVNLQEDIFTKKSNLKFDYNEIRARRNILAHRGSKFDSEYISKITGEKNLSKSGVDKETVNRIRDFFDVNFYRKIDQEVSFEDLLNQRIQITPLYFYHTYFTFIKLYLDLWLSVSQDYSEINSLALEMLFLSRKAKNFVFVLFSISLLTYLVKEKISRGSELDLDTEYTMANYLLSLNELRRRTKIPRAKFNKIEFVTEYIKYFKSHKNKLFAVLLAVIQDDFDKAMKELENCEPIFHKRQKEEWFLFIDLKEHSSFDSVFNKLIKKSST